ncbi:MAG: serine/threonine protein kinase, partial [Candidatus Margulisiibacteriota bacterium]
MLFQNKLTLTEITWEALSEYNVIDIAEHTLKQKFENYALKRNSYVNRVFELKIQDTEDFLIVKFYRPNRWSKEAILAEHQFLQVLSEHEIPVIAPLSFNGQTLFEQNGLLFTFFPKKGGRALDEFDKNLWLQVGRLLGRVHLISKTLEVKNRIIWRPEIATKLHLETIKNAHCILPDFEKAFFDTAQKFIEKAIPLFSNTEAILLHGDCHRGNMIFRPSEGLFLIDFDDISIGPTVQDMWMLLPDSPENCETEIEWFVTGDRKST